MSPNTDFTVACLFYGNYPALAERLLGSLSSKAAAPLNFHLRLGLNNASDQTKAVIDKYIKIRDKKKLITHVFDDDSTTYKYPRMHQMIHSVVLTTPYFMWFDDDSCISPKAKLNWFGNVRKMMRNNDLIGKLYYKHLKGNQATHYEKSYWWNGKPIPTAKKVIFVTGGFWCVKSEILLRHDWPPVYDGLVHFGGDVALGELCRQHNYRQRNFEQEVYINADKQGRPSTSARRGKTKSGLYGY